MKTTSITKPLLAGGGAGVIDSFLLPYVAGFGFSTPVARMILGTAGTYFFKRKGLIKNMFTAEATVGAFQFGQGLVGGMSSSNGGGQLF